MKTKTQKVSDKLLPEYDFDYSKAIRGKYHKRLSLHPTQKEIDELWSAEAERRVDEIRSSKVKTIPGEEIFRKIRERLGS